MDADVFKRKMKDREIPSVVDETRMREVLKDGYRPLKNKLNKNGTLNLIMAIEEFGELQQEISKYIRGKRSHLDLVQEVADAYVSLEFVKGICCLSDEEISKAMNIKINRQEQRNSKSTF